MVCECDPYSNVTVCVSWTGQDPPEEPFDFFVDYACTGCLTAPNLELKTGGTWTIRARSPNGSSVDAASLGIISAFEPHNFTVKMGTGILDVGALNVKQIVLDPSGVSQWSSIEGGALQGHLTDGLVVKGNDSHEGGEVEFYISGNAGDITARRVNHLTIAGASTGNISIGGIEELGQLAIGDTYADPCGEKPEVLGEINVGDMADYSLIRVFGDVLGGITVSDHMGAGAGLDVWGSVGAVKIQLPAIDTGGTSPAYVEFGNKGLSAPCGFAGTLMLAGGVNEDTIVKLFGTLDSDAAIDLNGGDVAGLLDIRHGGDGEIKNGGNVMDTGVVILAHGSDHNFMGTASFASVLEGGLIQTDAGAGLRAPGRIAIGGDVDGSVVITGNQSGDVDIFDGLDGVVELGGSLSGDIVTGDSISTYASVTVGGHVSSVGRVTVGDSLDGAVSVGSDLYGDINVKNDVAGSITINGAVRTGRIMVDGLLNGPVSIAQSTGTASLIHATQGIDSSGNITINASGGDYDADGTILVGDDGTIPIGNVTFDGCIHINDGSGGGDLNGPITVIGCHATSDDLAICVDGETKAAINITQTHCTPQVSHSCTSPCP